VNRALSAICAAMAAFILLDGSAALAAVITSTTANGPGLLISGTIVSLYVPYASDNSLKIGSALKVIEGVPAASASNTVALKTGYVNSCAASPASDLAICSGLFGSFYSINSSNKVTGFKTGVTKRIHFTGGDCANCGVAIDDTMGTAIISTSQGYLPVKLSPLRLETILSTNGEAISGQFGYDPTDQFILSPNYQIKNLKHFNTGPPHYQIIKISDGSAFDLVDQSTFFNSHGTCMTMGGGTTQRDALPDSGAYDINTEIAYGTFRSPADCIIKDSVEDIALFDLKQATFDTSTGTWATPGKQVQTLSEMTDLTNGLTGIAIVPGQSLAIVADRREISGSAGFGALSLPTTSGSGIPAIQDWVQAEMPKDPLGKPWQMGFMPNGLTAYLSPNNGKGYGVIVNRTRTFAAVVDIAMLLGAPRQTGTMHTVSTSENLVTDDIVRFVDIRPGK
jgi:hypothetical protein